MRSVLLVGVIAAFAPFNLAAVAQGFLKDPKYPGKCVIDDIILSAGEEMTLTERCEQIVCHEESYVSFFSCGVIGTPSGYVLGEIIDPNAEYPKCCARKIIQEVTSTTETQHD